MLNLTQKSFTRRWRHWAAAGICFCLTVSVRADTVTLNSGEVFEGQIISETDDSLEMEVAMFRGTIIQKKHVAKADVKSIIRESPTDRQEKTAYDALTKYALNPDQELGKDEYAAGIAAFQEFLTRYPASSHTGDVSKAIADWNAEASNVATGKVKFAGQWMSPEEKTARARQAQLEAEIESARNSLPAHKAQLTDLQTQRDKLKASVAVVQARLAAAQAKLASIPESPPSPGTTSVGADRPGLAGQLTQKIKIPSQTDTESKPAPNPARTQLQNDIATYQQQVNEAQSSLSALDTKIQQLQTEIPKLEETAKLAKQLTPEPASATKTNATPTTRQKSTMPTPSAKPEPPPPWYLRAWKWVSGFWH